MSRQQTIASLSAETEKLQVQAEKLAWILQDILDRGIEDKEAKLTWVSFDRDGIEAARLALKEWQEG